MHSEGIHIFQHIICVPKGQSLKTCKKIILNSTKACQEDFLSIYQVRVSKKTTILSVDRYYITCITYVPSISVQVFFLNRCEIPRHFQVYQTSGLPTQSCNKGLKSLNCVSTPPRTSLPHKTINLTSRS